MTTDPADQIAAALQRVRGIRPRPPWAGGGDAPRHGHGPFDHPHAHGRPGRGGPPWIERGGGRFGAPARFRLLEALAAASHPLTVSEIAEAVGVDQPRASRLVQQAVESGMARREADPDDARRTRVALTDAGGAFVRSFRGERRDAVRTALDGFTDAERRQLADLLSRFADAWPRG